MALSWTAPAEDAGSVTGYEVLRAQGTRRAGHPCGRHRRHRHRPTPTPALAETWDDYRYQVKALRGADASQGSNVARVSVSLFDNAGAIVPRADCDAWSLIPA